MTRALLLSEHDLAEWESRYRRGDVPARLPYGVDALGTDGFHLRGLRRSKSTPVRKADAVIEHRSGFKIEQAIRAVGPARRAHVVLALLERQGMTLARLKRWRVPPFGNTPLVIWSCWLADDLRRAEPDSRRQLAQQLQAVDLITHLSRHETEIFTDLGIPEERLFPVTYGVSHTYYRPDSAVRRDIDLLAVGQDRGRDYATLIEAVRGTSLTLDLVCRPENLAGIRLPANVRIHGTVALPTYRSMLQRAKVVAVPTREMAYPSGSSVALEAASSGCAVVVSGTKAMRDYFVDSHNGMLVEERDIAGWRSTLRGLHENPVERQRLGVNARACVEETFNADHMWQELALIMRARGVVA